MVLVNVLIEIKVNALNQRVSFMAPFMALFMSRDRRKHGNV